VGTPGWYESAPPWRARGDPCPRSPSEDVVIVPHPPRTPAVRRLASLLALACGIAVSAVPV